LSLNFLSGSPIYQTAWIDDGRDRISLMRLIESTEMMIAEKTI